MTKFIKNIKQLSKDVNIPINTLDHLELFHNTIKILKKYGWKHDGSGSMAQVFEHPDKKYVLKIFNPKDRGYLEFLKLTKKYPSKHWPIFGSKLIKLNNNITAIEMEKLYDLETDEEYELAFDAYSYLICNTKSDVFLESEELDCDTENENSNKKLGKSLVKALNVLAKVKDFYLDMTPENIMKRENGTLVIIDPFFAPSQFKKRTKIK